MLVLTVKPGESFVVGDATIHIERNHRICIDAPKSVRVVRSSVLERDKKNGEEKATNKNPRQEDRKGGIRSDQKRFRNR